MKEAYLPLPMASGRELNGYRTADEWPLVYKTDGYPTKVRWPSDSRWMAIGPEPDGHLGATPMAIGLQMNGHRTADGWCFGHKSPPFLPFEGQISRVDYARFERLYFVYSLSDNGLA